MSLSTALALRFSRRVRTVSPEWFRQHVLPAYSDTWDTAESAMRADPNVSRFMGELADELAAYGIQRPVSVFFERWCDRRLTVADGMHRSIAAMRLGIPIPIGINYQHPDLHPQTDVYRVTADGMPADDLLIAVLDLASFRSEDGSWIQADNASGTGDHTIELYLPCHPDRRRTVAAELEERLRGSGIAANVDFLANRNG